MKAFSVASRLQFLVLITALLGASLTNSFAAESKKAKKKKAKAAEAAKWNVDKHSKHTTEQAIDTTEGTWVNLDVSPDGKEIVFDLLGDLYVMPIGGSKSPRKLTEGMAWDMQPRFSPDGKTIAFTSDRTGKNGFGGDNIWTIGVDGKNPTQISTETFRLVNGPAWRPDGEYIVARKHFVSRRSLGAGEMWLYHKNGGTSGLQLTKKPTDQKDVNEPIFSPDGKYLYYSEDASPGKTFEYSKDSNQQIYVVNRLELETGESERHITGPGGACRPTPSPDGKTIAFVRRVDGKTGLHLFDPKSGAVRLVYDDLERDMQETWAIHGVYPGFAWTSDAKAVVIWARGKIRRIDIAAGKASVIPFHIKDTRAIVKALRFPQKVAPRKFAVKMIRWMQTSPAGDKVAFQALGHIYLRNLPEGEATRITDQEDHFEFFPSFSPDGTQVAYATWNDEKLGTIRIRTIAGPNAGQERIVVKQPGHYAAPIFSADGQTLVFTKLGGGWLRTPLWGRETGIYRIPSKGGKPERVTKTISRAFFGPENDRIYLTRRKSDGGGENLQFYSIDLSGNEERVHFTSKWGFDFCLSPNGKWIAFVERFNVYLAPFIKTGQTIAVGPGTKSLPLEKVSSGAGDWIHFSGDSKRVHWSLGPTLFTRELTNTFAFLEGAPDKLPEPETTGINVGFKATHHRPRGTIALLGGRIITMKGDQVIEDGAIVIKGNRITAIGKRDEVEIPANANKIDVSGQVILPGFVDTHAHGAQARNGITPQQNWVDYARLAFGVTTVHDPSNNTQDIFAASEMTKAGVIIAPRTFSTGTILYGAEGSFKAEIASKKDATFHLKRMKAVGAFSVKSYNQPRRDQRQQVIEAARELKMMVVPEGGSTYMHNLTMIVDGHTGIEHTLPVEMIYDDALDLWRDTGVGYTPTLSVAYGGIWGENYWYDIEEVWKNPRVMSFIPPHLINPRARRRTKAPLKDYNHIRQARITKRVIDNGGMVQAGGHGQLNGLNTHWEMWSMVQGGMTPIEALRCGTLFGAKYVGLDGDIGSLETGKLADLIVIEKGSDPTKNIRHSERIQYVVANGRLFDAKTMDELTKKGRKKRQPFYWERSNAGIGTLPTPSIGCEACGIPGLGGWMLQTN